jgi:hypothetical protein
MYRIDEIKCVSDEEIESDEILQEDEDYLWGEGCCEDVLMDDEFYEREYCD